MKNEFLERALGFGQNVVVPIPFKYRFGVWLLCMREYICSLSDSIRVKLRQNISLRTKQHEMCMVHKINERI